MAAVNSGAPSASTIDLWTIRGVPGDISNPLLTPTLTTLPIATISQPPNAVQKGTGIVIDTNDDSLLDASFRDGPSGSIWVSANDACAPPGDVATRSCLRFINDFRRNNPSADPGAASRLSAPQKQSFWL